MNETTVFWFFATSVCKSINSMSQSRSTVWLGGVILALATGCYIAIYILYNIIIFDLNADITLDHLTVVPVSLSTVRLEWKVIPTDGHHCITSYNIQVSGPDGSQWGTQMPGSLECTCSHWRSIHIVLLPTFHLLTLVHLITSALLSSKHQLWYFKACTTNYTNHADNDRVHVTA